MLQEKHALGEVHHLHIDGEEGIQAIDCVLSDDLMARLGVAQVGLIMLRDQQCVACKNALIALGFVELRAVRPFSVVMVRHRDDCLLWRPHLLLLR